MNYQKIVLSGYTTVIPELKESKGGSDYATFSLAVNQDNEDHTDFFPIVCFGSLAAAVANFVDKGQLLLVEGRVKLDKEGKCSVLANRAVFGPKSQRQEEGADSFSMKNGQI